MRINVGKGIGTDSMDVNRFHPKGSHAANTGSDSDPDTDFDFK